MSDEVKVHVVEFSDRKFYMMQWLDPMTGRKQTRSTKVVRTGLKRDRTEAERVAAKMEAELREGRYKSPSRITWPEFRQRYEDEVVAGLADRTADKIGSMFNMVEEILSPQRLRDLTEIRISHYAAKLREMGRTEDTIKGHLAHLGAALRWAERVKMIPKAPHLEMPKRVKKAKGMKGRPITTEEFERMLAKVEDVLATPEPEKPRRERKRTISAEALAKMRQTRRERAQQIAPSWEHYLRGLWLSGLRLTESLELYWDRDDRLCVDLSGKRPMLRIPGELEKGNQDRVLPMAPEFCEFLLATPPSERTGPVFNPVAIRGASRIKADRAMKIIAAIGEAAKVVVDVDPKTRKVKYASAHDLRRSFGERWAVRVMPQVLQELMRHESIQTTLKYYVGRNAERTADVLWEAHEAAKSGRNGNTLGNTAPIASEDNADASF